LFFIGQAPRVLRLPLRTHFLNESEPNALLRGVAAANVVHWKRLAQAAPQAYNVSSQLVKQEEYAFLLPHVERPRRLPKFGRRRTRVAAEAGLASSRRRSFRLTRATT
jgi:hypothetical protein